MLFNFKFLTFLIVHKQNNTENKSKIMSECKNYAIKIYTVVKIEDGWFV